MSTVKTSKKSILTQRRALKKAVDELPADRLDTLADYLLILKRPSLKERLKQAKKDIASGNTVKWRKVRRDV